MGKTCSMAYLALKWVKEPGNWFFFTYLQDFIDIFVILPTVLNTFCTKFSVIALSFAFICVILVYCNSHVFVFGLFHENCRILHSLMRVCHKIEVKSFGKI